MRYMGGKYRLKKEITEVINAVRAEDQFYWEPFVGSAWVTTELEKGNIFCSDINPYLIKMWRAILSGWIPPNQVTEEEYEYIKNHKDESPKLTAFVGFGCSWGGKWFGGYAREEGRNFAENAKNSLLRKVKKIPKPVTFFTHNFFTTSNPEMISEQLLIYCDPPYKGMTGFDAVDYWDSERFWNKVRELDELSHTLIISEYKAPDDFRCIKSFSTKTDLNTNNGKDDRIEKLFMKR